MDKNQNCLKCDEAKFAQAPNVCRFKWTPVTTLDQKEKKCKSSQSNDKHQKHQGLTTKKITSSNVSHNLEEEDSMEFIKLPPSRRRSHSTLEYSCNNLHKITPESKSTTEIVNGKPQVKPSKSCNFLYFAQDKNSKEKERQKEDRRRFGNVYDLDPGYFGGYPPRFYDRPVCGNMHGIPHQHAALPFPPPPPNPPWVACPVLIIRSPTRDTREMVPMCTRQVLHNAGTSFPHRTKMNNKRIQTKENIVPGIADVLGVSDTAQITGFKLMYHQEGKECQVPCGDKHVSTSGLCPTCGSFLPDTIADCQSEDKRNNKYTVLESEIEQDGTLAMIDSNMHSSSDFIFQDNQLAKSVQVMNVQQKNIGAFSNEQATEENSPKRSSILRNPATRKKPKSNTQKAVANQTKIRNLKTNHKEMEPKKENNMKKLPKIDKTERYESTDKQVLAVLDSDPFANVYKSVSNQEDVKPFLETVHPVAGSSSPLKLSCKIARQIKLGDELSCFCSKNPLLTKSRSQNFNEFVSKPIQTDKASVRKSFSGSNLPYDYQEMSMPKSKDIPDDLNSPEDFKVAGSNFSNNYQGRDIQCYDVSEQEMLNSKNIPKCQSVQKGSNILTTNVSTSESWFLKKEDMQGPSDLIAETENTKTIDATPIEMSKKPQSTFSQSVDSATQWYPPQSASIGKMHKDSLHLGRISKLILKSKPTEQDESNKKVSSFSLPSSKKTQKDTSVPSVPAEPAFDQISQVSAQATQTTEQASVQASIDVKISKEVSTVYKNPNKTDSSNDSKGTNTKDSKVKNSKIAKKTVCVKPSCKHNSKAKVVSCSGYLSKEYVLQNFIGKPDELPMMTENLKENANCCQSDSGSISKSGTVENVEEQIVVEVRDTSTSSHLGDMGLVSNDITSETDSEIKDCCKGNEASLSVIGEGSFSDVKPASFGKSNSGGSGKKPETVDNVEKPIPEEDTCHTCMAGTDNVKNKEEIVKNVDKDRVTKRGTKDKNVENESIEKTTDPVDVNRSNANDSNSSRSKKTCCKHVSRSKQNLKDPKNLVVLKEVSKKICKPVASKYPMNKSKVPIKYYSKPNVTKEESKNKIDSKNEPEHSDNTKPEEKENKPNNQMIKFNGRETKTCTCPKCTNCGFCACTCRNHCCRCSMMPDDCNWNLSGWNCSCGQCFNYTLPQQPQMYGACPNWYNCYHCNALQPEHPVSTDNPGSIFANRSCFDNKSTTKRAIGGTNKGKGNPDPSCYIFLQGTQCVPQCSYNTNPCNPYSSCGPCQPCGSCGSCGACGSCRPY